MGCGLLFFAPFYIVGIFTLFLALRRTVPLCIGTAISGTVTDRSIDDSDESTSNNLTFAYRIGPREHHATRSVDSDLYAAFRQGSAIQVLIIPALPNWPAELANPGAHGSIRFLWLWVIVWDGFLFGLTRLIVKSAREQRRLISRGIPTVGEIVSKETELDDEKKATYFVR